MNVLKFKKNIRELMGRDRKQIDFDEEAFKFIYLTLHMSESSCM